MNKLIDISVPVRSGMLHWPGSRACKISQAGRVAEGAESNVSWFEGEVHTGTHVDAPRHFFDDGATVDELPMDLWIGPAYVADIAKASVITAAELEKESIPPQTRRLLLRTKNSQLWGSDQDFLKDYVGLSVDGAQWLVDRGIRLVGIDYLSIARFEDVVPVHRLLLKAGMALLEGLNLSLCEEGRYRLYCLPVRLEGAEAAPARALLQKENEG
ncbi:MAG: cyclase family protein [Lentisphaerota bacterium]